MSQTCSPRDPDSRGRNRPRDRRSNPSRPRGHRSEVRLGRAGRRRGRDGRVRHAASRTRCSTRSGRTKVAIKGPITTPVGTGFRSVNVALRKELDLYMCLRPCKSYPGVRSRYEDIDLVIVRENHEDLYAGIEFEQGSSEAAQADRLHRRSGSAPNPGGLRHLDQADLRNGDPADRPRRVRLRDQERAARRSPRCTRPTS